jgi:hypothetical protein
MKLAGKSKQIMKENLKLSRITEEVDAEQTC